MYTVHALINKIKRTRKALDGELLAKVKHNSIGGVQPDGVCVCTKKTVVHSVFCGAAGKFLFTKYQ